MGRLTCLKPRVAPANVRRVSTLTVASTVRITGTTGQSIRERVMRRDRGMCQPCLRDGYARLAQFVDHIVPLWAGGAEADENRQAICKPCHDAKSAAEAAARAAGEPVQGQR